MSSQPSAATTHQPNPAEQVIQLSSGYMVSAAIQVVVKLSIADRLAAGPLPVSELANAAGVSEDCLYRVMRALASVGVFNEIGMRYFELTPQADALRADSPNSVRDMVLWLSDPLHFETWADMMHCVKTGQTAAEHIYKKPIFEHFAEHPEISTVFNAAMTDFSKVGVRGVLQAYDFSGIGTLVDIAGGHGFVLTSVLQQYPEMRGMLFEIEHVAEGARQNIQRLGLEARCRVLTGDFFAEIPMGGDTYMMQHIIHDWDDEKSVQILRNVRKALGTTPNGKLLLLEGVIVPGNQPDFTKLIDLEMLILPGGRERTEAEYGELLEKSGFRLNRVVRTQSPVSVIEALPV